MANNAIVNMFRIKELRGRVFFTLIALAVFRLGSVLTIPGVNPGVLINYFREIAKDSENSIASYLDFFAGGAFSNFSIFMLGVMPYISTQIIMQLALVIFPSLKRVAQEDGGQRKIQEWTRLGTVFVCLIQSLAVTAYATNIDAATTAQNGVHAIVFNNKLMFKLLAMLSVTTGSMITVWIGNQITARGIGNGISILIYAGIVARLPHAVIELVNTVKASGNSGDIVKIIVVFIMFICVIALVVFEQSGERKIPVHYAKRVIGRRMYGGQNTYIPFKINPSGVIPIIFASSFLTFPLQIASGLGGNIRWLAKISAALSPTGALHNILLIILIVFFAYFYTQVTLNPTEITKNIRENGGSIPGIRTDRTEEYLQKVLNRLVLPGSLYLALIAVLPTAIQIIFKFPAAISMLMGGTSLMILVGVDLDTMSQVDALLKMHHADSMVRKGRIRSRNL